MPTLRFHTGSWVTSASPKRTVPRSGVTKPAMMRSRVVLPDPDGPSRLVKRPGSKAALTPSSTVRRPYSLPIETTSTPITAASEMRELREDEHQQRRDREEDRRDGVDLRREPLADRRVDLDRQGADAGRR